MKPRERNLLNPDFKKIVLNVRGNFSLKPFITGIMIKNLPYSGLHD